MTTKQRKFVALSMHRAGSRAYLPKDTDPILRLRIPIIDIGIGHDVLDKDDLSTWSSTKVVHFDDTLMELRWQIDNTPVLWLRLDRGIKGYIEFEDGKVPSLGEIMVLHHYKDLSFGDNDMNTKVVLEVSGYEYFR